jgi:phage tail P2-like protein
MSNLLPPNATPLTRALAEVISRQLPVLIKQVKNPDTCPAFLLPWLAWEFGVEGWDSSWNEQQKRDVIKSASAIHKRRGTVGALKRALAAFGYQIEVQEWFQVTPIGDPYTYALQVVVEDVGIPDMAGFASIVRVAESAQNERSELIAVNVLGITRGVMTVGGAVFCGKTITIHP